MDVRVRKGATIDGAGPGNSVRVVIMCMECIMDFIRYLTPLIIIIFVLVRSLLAGLIAVELSRNKYCPLPEESDFYSQWSSIGLVYRKGRV